VRALNHGECVRHGSPLLKIIPPVRTLVEVLCHALASTSAVVPDTANKAPLLAVTVDSAAVASEVSARLARSLVLRELRVFVESQSHTAKRSAAQRAQSARKSVLSMMGVRDAGAAARITMTAPISLRQGKFLAPLKAAAK
jgi:hypothetical protein